MRYDRKARRWVSFLNEFSGEMIDRSPDGQWLAHVKFPGFALHKCRIDGSGDVLLAPGMNAANPRWSPDGKLIAFSGIPVGTTRRRMLWLVSAGGGDAAPYRPEIVSGSDAIWSGDGKRILLGQMNTGSPQERIRILRLETGELEMIPGSEELFSPRWSPDEKEIVAVDVGFTGKVRIFDRVKREWRQLTEQSIGYPTWSRDGKYIYAQTGPPSMPEALRIEVATGRREEIARMDFRAIGNFAYWVGWTEDWEPLTIRDLSSTQIYRIDLDR